MAFTYAITMNLEGKACAVVGGGKVAARKVQSLLEECARVTVISPELCDELQDQAKPFTWIQSEYSLGTLADDTILVIAATDSRQVNHQVSLDCRANRIPVNVIDSREDSDFTVNATVQRGDLLLSVSTNGKSPALSRKIRMDLEEVYGEEYGTALELMEEFRLLAMKKIQDPADRRLFLQELGNMNLAEELKNTSAEEVKLRVSKCLSSYLD